MAGDLGCSVGTQPGDHFAGFLGIADPPQRDHGFEVFFGFRARLGISSGGTVDPVGVPPGPLTVTNATFPLRSMRVETSLRLKFLAGGQLYRATFAKSEGSWVQGCV